MKILLDKSTENHKGLGRFTATLINSLNDLPVTLKTYSRKGPIYHPLAFMNFVNLHDWEIYITPHFILPLNILFSGKPIYITIHDIIPFKKFNIKFFILFSFLSIILKFQNIKILTPSITSKNKLKILFKIDENKIFVVNNEARIMESSNNKKNNTINIDKNDKDIIDILYIGNLKKHKNVNLIIKACELISKIKKKEIKLSIVGGFDTQSSIKENLSLDFDFINFHGAITDDEINFLIDNADYLVQPSFDEGFGIPILEALVKNKKVICSDIEVFHELYEEYSIFVNYYDPVLLAEIICNDYGDNKNKSFFDSITQKYSLTNIKKQLSIALNL